MATTLELLREGRRAEIWQKYCGFVDLELADFMTIQKRLLMEQIALLSKCELGRKLIGEVPPRSAEEFRATVPLTTYSEYTDFLLEKREDVLPGKPHWWLHTSGRSGEYPFKWIPYTEAQVQRLAEACMACVTFGASSGRGEFPYDENDTFLFTLAPYPYISGAIYVALNREFNFRYLPPLDEGVKMPFQTRIQEGFRMALKEGMDGFNGLGTVLVRIGDQFRTGGGSMKPSLSLLHPLVLGRLLRAFIRSRLAGRKYLLPKDIWRVKCIGVGGTDARLFKDQIKEYWGREPRENYACTEAGVLASQLWKGNGLVFYPDTNFLEFIPEDEFSKRMQDPSYQPPTKLLDEVEAGERYALVVTNFDGGTMVRYIIGDIIEIVSTSDPETGCKVPQMVFYSRVGDLIDIGGIARLTELNVWQAIADAQFGYTDWVARKEYDGSQVLLHLYIEPKSEVNVDEIRERISANLARLNEDYAALKPVWNLDPLRISLLPPGSHQAFLEQRLREGADLAQLKPPHMNPPDAVMELLLAARSD